MLKYISRTFCLLSSAVLLQEPLAASDEEKGLISIHSPPPAHHQPTIKYVSLKRI